MRIITKSVLLLIIQTTLLQGQSRNKLEFAGDLAQFRAKDGYTFVEIYYAIPTEGLTFQAAENGIEAQFALAYALKSADSVVAGKTWRCSHTLAEQPDTGAQGQQIAEQGQLYAKPGEYVLELMVRDLLADTSVVMSQNIVVKSFDPNSFGLSDIQLALQVQRAQQNDRFVKNGFRLVPNGFQLYGDRHSALYAYMEIYGLPATAEKPAAYDVQLSVLNGNGQEVLANPLRNRTTDSPDVIQLGSIDLSPLPSGKYTLDIMVAAAAEDTMHQQKTFYLYKKSELMDVVDEEAPFSRNPEFAAITERAADSLAMRLIYLADKAELRLFNTLNLEGKRRFLDKFWKAHDRQPESLANEFMDAYFNEIRHTEQRYSVGMKAGWKTDRGRVYMTYGQPDQLEKSPSNLGSKPFEIWYFNELDTGVEFVFVDRSGFGDYVLVHSTARGELRDYDWQEKWL